MANALVGLIMGAGIALMTALLYVRGVVGSRFGEPYRRDEQPISFRVMIISLGLLATFFLIRGASDLFEFLSSSN